MTLTTWLAFFAAAWAISISPGAGAVAAMNAGVNHGFRRGVITTAGLVLGILTQIGVVGVGLGALVAASSSAFAAIKWCGVAYLVWLGVQQWRAPAKPLVDTQAPALRRSAAQLLLGGWMVNAANPKGTVFLLAVVPQFLDPMRPLAPQYAVIAATLAFTDTVVMSAYTALAARVLRSLTSTAHVRAVNRTFGSLFIVAGTSLAIFKRAG